MYYIAKIQKKTEYKKYIPLKKNIIIIYLIKIIEKENLYIAHQNEI